MLTCMRGRGKCVAFITCDSYRISGHFRSITEENPLQRCSNLAMADNDCAILYIYYFGVEVSPAISTPSRS